MSVPRHLAKLSRAVRDSSASRRRKPVGVFHAPTYEGDCARTPRPPLTIIDMQRVGLFERCAKWLRQHRLAVAPGVSKRLIAAYR